ncbi:AAA family ATPase [Alteromonas ponticola]|uniref:AAA family ATPase n=1 Tax=Alteromonas aquimaris TaxID=2998417 RepID=A0ABT3P9A6_9ALTE|nr:AAA family ATPase [Alteromonas aquimaris]MCW8109362.1 AAA family ATPase [Alteromonas aquimaris]
MSSVQIDHNEPEPTNVSELNLFSASQTDAAPPSTALGGITKPVNLSNLGIGRPLLLDLLLKHILQQQVATLESLVATLCIPGKLILELLAEAKQMMWVENRASTAQARFSLSGSGRQCAEHLLLQSGYIGPVPVPLSQYTQVVQAQSHQNIRVTQAFMQERLAGESFESDALQAMGMALNSNKPVLLYGLPGSGKSYLCRQLIKVFDDEVMQPYAVEVNNQIIQLYDPQVHQLVLHPTETLQDTRYQLIKRPLVITGGELTLDMLEVSYDNIRHLYKAPLQMKANNGILLLDDLGRQQVSPAALFNRWIIPLEERKDFLTLSSGAHFEVPFELVMLFSTNLNPAELVDDAFLRRLGYKIQMQPLSQQQYQQLWQRVSGEYGLRCATDEFDYLVTTYHAARSIPFLPCYPRDLLGIVRDAVRYNSLPHVVTTDLLDNAWRHYFVNAV